MMCYAHIGQYSSCTFDWYRSTRPATYAEYAPLLPELMRLGYNSVTKRKITAKMNEKRRDSARKDVA